MTEETQSDPEKLINRLYEQINQHLETRWDYLSLTLTEKLSTILAGLAGAMVLMVFGLLMFFFFSLGFAWWLGDLIGNRAAGFALSGLVFAPIAFITYRWIGPFVREKVIETALNDAKNETPKDHG
jgi:hypothetical protein